MKAKLFYSLLALITFTAVGAQTKIPAKVFAGLTMGNLKFSDDVGSSTDYKTKPGFFIGASSLVDINETMGIDVDARVSMYRFKTDAGGGNDYNLTYFSLTPSFQYTTDFNLFAKAGPFVDYGISGTQKNGDASYKIFKEDAFKRLNIGIAAQLGYKLEKFDVFAEYRAGLNDIEGKDDDNNQKSKLSSFNIGVSFYL